MAGRKPGQKWPSDLTRDHAPRKPSVEMLRIQQAIAELEARKDALLARETHKGQLRRFLKGRALTRGDLMEIAREMPTKPPLVLGNGHDPAPQAQTDNPFVGRKSGDQKGKRRPKYANPANPAQTWAGVGHEPGWMKMLTKGSRKKRELYLIAKE